ncbi:MAG: thioredoxin family protein [Flavobacteriales bacterium]|nr:thioredoxin family protein [Flavobacteriia bacterium]NCP06150.1 thioredoxin family protein [Flavobacteriales bacterium]PIV93752.1 MAG: thioredoxin family protein [Flavobacteriaceae bacterium CG17_big_fil_post_rev_8_21_14_2_50_33_15]PIY11198.1 MAG: thioredoxin family protein [Flavobacteriaceae bacterium CG_4_10_14_3_um_filter_33_47]PJB17458.1 MAG: thioredoxin family protein [Flavobacteriaceae bacterium CG_4_9_14_3_um_filter_33_16]
MKTPVLLSIMMLTFMSDFTLNNVKERSGYQIGDVVADFELKNIDGNMVSLSDYKDVKGFIITFTCNTCPFSIAYEDRIMALNEKYASKGYPVIAINPNNPKVQPGDSYKSMQQRALEKGFTFPYLVDEGQQVYPKFGATKTPHMFVLQNTKQGPVVKYIGAIDDNYKDANAVNTKYVENAVNALLSGHPVKLQETKAIGCTIKV